VVNAVNLFAAKAFADESAYYGRSVGEVLAANPPAWPSTTCPTRPPRGC
jgi:hypothetical protein